MEKENGRENCTTKDDVETEDTTENALQTNFTIFSATDSAGSGVHVQGNVIVQSEIEITLRVCRSSPRQPY